MGDLTLKLISSGFVLLVCNKAIDLKVIILCAWLSLVTYSNSRKYRLFKKIRKFRLLFSNVGLLKFILKHTRNIHLMSLFCSRSVFVHDRTFNTI